MKNRRVVVTGIGTICCNGVGKDILWKSLTEGVSKIDRISCFDPSSLYSQVAGEARDFNPADFMDSKEAKRMGRFNHFSLCAARMALEDAHLTITDDISTSTGVLIGSCFGGMITFYEQFQKFAEKGASRISPFFIPMLINNMAPGQISINFNIKGPNYSIASACATGAHCIGESFRLVREGVVDIMVAGGTDTVVHPLIMAGFGNMKALTGRNSEPGKACRPFDRGRDGFIMAEGAGILIVEALESAKRRNAPVYGEIIGFGMNADGHHITAPDPEGKGARKAMKLALDDGNIRPEQVDYINAHGTSTPYNDRIESYAIKQVFGSHSGKLAVSSNKSMIGHTMGAAGAIEFAATLLTLKENIIPPTINYEEPDPDCDLDYVPNKAREQKVDIAMSNSFGFGGVNAILVAKKYTD